MPKGTPETKKKKERITKSLKTDFFSWLQGREIKIKVAIQELRGLISAGARTQKEAPKLRRITGSGGKRGQRKKGCERTHP